MNLKKIAIIGLFVLLAGAAISIVLNVRDTLVNKSDEITVKESYTNIDILSDNASVEIIPTKNNHTEVKFSGKMKQKSRYRFNADVKGDTLYVELKEKNWSFIQFGFTSLDIKLIVYVPEKEYDELRTEIDNGRIISEGLQVKDLNLETDNGSIELKNVQAQTVSLQTDNGQILLDEVGGEINAKTDNGRILLTTSNLERFINLKTDNGLIEIQTDKEPSNVTIDAKVDLGKIDVFGSSNKQTIFGNGTNLIKLETDNGKISVSK